MHKALVFTDLHIPRAGETIIGLDPMARFAEGLAHALHRHPDAAHIIITGDLTHTGHAAEYARLAAALAACPIPITLTLGNHDHRPTFDAAFPDVTRTPDGHAQTALDLGGARLLVLDTHDDHGHAPPHGGWLCPARLDWLDRELARADREGRPVVVLCHHPPFDTGFDGMDAIKLANGDELLHRLQRARVLHLICGHIHRTIHLSLDGLPASVLKSPCHQMPLLLGPQDVHLSVDEPGAYGVLIVSGRQSTLFTEDFALSTGTGDTYG